MFYFIASFFTIVRDEKKINCFFEIQIRLVDNSSPLHFDEAGF
ncbi:hypothetical protein A1Q_4749 [Vibrio campbellii HY01]|nr:hypothetical protein M892_05260 [Vibrio campbellii ATCC BAA-1116]EDL67153.1 hypothetical protein A1Q_4749 [Vibrio campbellii HY01]